MSRKIFLFYDSDKIVDLKQQFQLVTGPMVQWFTTSPLHGEDPEFEPRLDHTRFFYHYYVRL